MLYRYKDQGKRESQEGESLRSANLDRGTNSQTSLITIPYDSHSLGALEWSGTMWTYDNTFIPSKYDQFVETGNKIPSGSDVASYEDGKSKNGEGVHVGRWY